MKKPLIVLAILVVTSFTLVAVLRRRAVDRLEVGEGPASAEKERIRNFWETYHKANTLRLQSAYAEAASAYLECLRLNPSHEDSLYYLGSCFEELGDYTQAAATYRKLIAVNAASDRAFSELGNTLSAVAPGAPVDLDQARQVYQRSIEINREQAGPFLHLGSLELNERHYQAALEDFRLAAGFGAPEGNFLVAYTLFLQQKYCEAVQPLRKVLEGYAKDRKIIKKGVFSEGDVLPAPGKPLTPLEKTGLKSILLLYWIAQHLGGYPAEIPAEFQVPAPSSGTGVSPLRGHSQDGRATVRADHGFALVTAKLGVKLSAGRAAWADFDKDGRTDLLTAGSGSPVLLYRNLEGKLLDVTASAGLAGVRGVWDARWVDYDGDGYPDLYFLRSGFSGAGQNLLYHNNRDGTFTDVTAAMGLEGERSTAGACFADFDGDGRPSLVEVGASDATHSAVRFFRNSGQRFVEETRQAGLPASRDGTAVDCAVADTTRSGKPDVFVYFWRREAALYRNQGRGEFRDATAEAGLQGIRGQGFSAIFFDYDNDCWPDLLVTTQAPYEESVRCLLQPTYRTNRDTPRLFRNRGNGSFEETTARVGLNRSYGTMQALAVDLDGDGWKDLVLVNGSLDALRLEPSVVLRNVKGTEFREWLYVPDFASPANFIGASTDSSGGVGKPKVFFAANPRLRVAASTLWTSPSE